MCLCRLSTTSSPSELIIKELKASFFTWANKNCRLWEHCIGKPDMAYFRSAVTYVLALQKYIQNQEQRHKPRHVSDEFRRCCQIRIECDERYVWD